MQKIDDYTINYEPFKTFLKYLEREGWQINDLLAKSQPILGKMVTVVRAEIEYDGEKRVVNEILTPSVHLTMIKPRPLAARRKNN